MKFNKKTIVKPHINTAGGPAYAESATLELTGLVLTSFVEPQFYRSGPAVLQRLRDLVPRVSPQYCRNLAVYARNAFGMRSITHALICEIVRSHGQAMPTRGAVRDVVRRPDDMTEILAYWGFTYGKPIPNPLRRGLRDAFAKFDPYSLGKYREEGSAVKLVDVMNLCHPKPSVRNEDALARLAAGTLRSFDTWEVELSNPNGRTKAQIWQGLMESGKLGYFALLRNLRNIERECDAAGVALATRLLTDDKAIEKSLVLPFRFFTAFQHVETLAMKRAVAQAADLALMNTPVFPGKTLVALDCSGSMRGKPIDIGAMFAAALLRRNDSDLCMFSSRAEVRSLAQKNASVIEIANAIKEKVDYAGTDFNAIFHAIGRTHYDRIFILSDMQGWIENPMLKRSVATWKAASASDPRIYSFNLNDYGSLMFPEANVFAIAGWSEKVFDLINLLDKDSRGVVDFISAQK